MSAGQQGGNFGTVFHPEPDPLPPGNGGPVRPGPLRPLPRRRRPGMIALAVALIGVGILGGATLFAGVNHQVPVLLVTTAVPAGTEVTAASAGAGPAAALTFAQTSASGYLLSPAASAGGSSATTIVVTVTGSVPSLVPGVPIRVSQVAQAPVERFTTP